MKTTPEERSFDPSIFHDYDVRGIYPTQVHEDAYYRIGRAIASYLDVAEIAVGRDCRLSSPSLFDALVHGITDQGTNVVDLGLMSTEMHYFASGKYGFGANVIVSASHNPPQYNGIKMVVSGVVPLHGENGFPQIKSFAEKQNYPAPKRKGTIRKQDIFEAWIDHIISFITPNSLRALRVVVDAGNGMGGPTWAALAKRLPVTIIPLYFDPDGNFPNHLADPLKKENLIDLQKAIRSHNADMGLALDGDADRVFVLDENGQTISGTITTAMLAKEHLETHGPSTILYNVVCGRVVAETIRKNSGVGRRVRVGHSFIKEYMKKYDGLMAGEHSGHFYFKKNYYADSSAIAGLLLIQFLSTQQKKMSRLAEQYDIYKSSGELNFTVDNAQKIMDTVEKNSQGSQSIDHIDGLSVFYTNWWFNLRPSKTEPLLRLNVEADNEELLKKGIEKITKIIKNRGKG